MEKTNFVVYEKILEGLNKVVYVGMGSEARANELHRSNDTFNKFADDGYITTNIIHRNLTEGEAKRLETLLIKHYGIENLFNASKGVNGYDNEEYDSKKEKTELDSLIDIIEASVNGYTVQDKHTPNDIVKEITDSILNSSGFVIDNKKILNPNARTGEFYKYITDKTGIESVRNNFTMIEESQTKLQIFMASNINKEKMHNIKIINDDFNNFNTNEKYDIILMNPPFAKFGLKFIEKCMSMLNDKGFLGVVIHPSWRTPSTTKKDGINKEQNKKLYTKMLNQGAFHFIHMYSIDKTTELFKQTIGQVDTFVWQKGVKEKTKIINSNNEEYTCNLNNYPQTPPVLPTYIYDKYFDQINGIKWNRFGHPRDKSYGITNIKFTDKTNNKEYTCNQVNIDKTKGKKIYVNMSFSKYIIDDIGDDIVNDRTVFYFNTTIERNNIIKTLDYIIDNKLQDIFTSQCGSFKSAMIPGIKI